VLASAVAVSGPALSQDATARTTGDAPSVITIKSDRGAPSAEASRILAAIAAED
jgi:hypothetical protein